MSHKKKKLVVLTGAGISADSGLKTFRDHDGLWMGYNIEDVATPRAFAKDPQLVLDFYNMRRREVRAANPNAAHTGLAELEKYFDVDIVTQNIDDLHERGGSSRVLHLHGEIFKMCNAKKTDVVSVEEDILLGDTAADGSQLRPFIVWFEEDVPLLETAAALVQEADLFVVVGTSLQVYPAAGLIHFTKPGVPTYVIDRNIPRLNLSGDVIAIEESAADGVTQLTTLLLDSMAHD